MKLADTGLTYGPAPRLNPEGLLMGAWVVRRGRRIVARFATDGRDQAEAYLLARRAPLVYGPSRSRRRARRARYQAG